MVYLWIERASILGGNEKGPITVLFHQGARSSCSLSIRSLDSNLRSRQVVIFLTWMGSRVKIAYKQMSCHFFFVGGGGGGGGGAILLCKSYVTRLISFFNYLYV